MLLLHGPPHTTSLCCPHPTPPSLAGYGAVVVCNTPHLFPWVLRLCCPHPPSLIDYRAGGWGSVCNTPHMPLLHGPFTQLASSLLLSTFPSLIDYRAVVVCAGPSPWWMPTHQATPSCFPPLQRKCKRVFLSPEQLNSLTCWWIREAAEQNRLWMHFAFARHILISCPSDYLAGRGSVLFMEGSVGYWGRWSLQRGESCF